MSVTIHWPSDSGVLSTCKVINVDVTHHVPDETLAKISLVFYSSHEIVPGTHQSIPPNTLEGADYMNGVMFIDGKCHFKVRCAALSQHNNQRLFRFKVTVNGLNIFSEEFKTLTKLYRKPVSSSKKRVRLRSDDADVAIDATSLRDESANEGVSNDGASDITTFLPHWVKEENEGVFDLPLDELSDNLFPDVDSSSLHSSTMTQLLHEVTSLRADVQDMRGLLRELVNKGK
tara:strand:+ start:1863 stop:2555 length:693 start_codon:yes stop_codon:yes gene_type:complete